MGHTFAKDNLKPICNLINIDLCSDEKKALIDSLQTKSIEELQADVKVAEDELARLEKEYSDELQKLQVKYNELSKAKVAGEHHVKEEDGYSLIKAVLLSKQDAS